LVFAKHKGKELRMGRHHPVGRELAGPVFKHKGLGAAKTRTAGLSLRPLEEKRRGQKKRGNLRSI